MNYGYTTIFHEARIKMGISLNDYAVADLIYRLSVNQDAPILGWCSMANKNIAQALGLDVKTTQRILNRLTEKGILEKSESGRYYRTGSGWILKQGQNDPNNRDKMTLKQGQNDPKNRDKMTLYNNNTIIDNKRERESKRAIDFLKQENPTWWDSFRMQYKTQVDNWGKLEADFNDKADIEQLPYISRVITARLSSYTRNWIHNQDRDQQKTNEKKYEDLPLALKLGGSAFR